MKWLQKKTLNGHLVDLIPIDLSHEKELIKAAQDGKLWELWFTSVPAPENTKEYIQKALEEYETDTSLPFVARRKSDGVIVGSTRLMKADSKNKRVEIGTTWYAKSAQRSGINTDCKLLLLSHAFEELGCMAVEFRTHFHNVASRNAIASLGAKQDGILRNHQIDKKGNIRDTVVFSILDSEWKTVRFSLEFKLYNKYKLPKV
ncbi:GNAT family N-acetyltransferase [Flammeovirga yaeyamensis]|uniref:GNAT family N-acetyltransferase n=1 Tax=Flammeovirga yaeyamensis TaxID=367791 RepID=A0AAX1MYW9_9BACT|nr:GNAT family protein [Flammeovirga yaeyamensis]MBB3696221.1 RimJ/RimL family protein N-acetyltransferase [Flammeovirga yaeyamensis]NMF34902.1 GNAT family N-acetyltransferase [Flammeovirga yaeyamensis]QWG00272.1 GNAT family N-acetyltransferase [Flammeovirga yaeyamensis]